MSHEKHPKNKIEITEADLETNYEQSPTGHNKFDLLINSLSRKKELSQAEKQLIEYTADMSARSIQYMIEQQGAQLPETKSFKDNVRTFSLRAGRMLERAGRLDKDMKHALDGMSEKAPDFARVAAAYSAESFSAGGVERPNVEDCAIALAPMLDEVMAHNSDIQVDRYLEGNFNSMAAYYERAQQ